MFSIAVLTIFLHISNAGKLYYTVDKCSVSENKGCLVGFFMNAFEQGKPEKLVTDKGSEFINGDLQAMLQVEGVEWQGLPQNTPEAGGLIERLVLTLKRGWLLWKDSQTMPELRRSLVDFTS